MTHLLSKGDYMADNDNQDGNTNPQPDENTNQESTKQAD